MRARRPANLLALARLPNHAARARFVSPMSLVKHPRKHISPDRWPLRILVWVAVPAIAVVVCALGGAVLGMLIGDTMGSPEGEGFIGFLYGVYIGGPAGVLIGAVAAWRIDAAVRT